MKSWLRWVVGAVLTAGLLALWLAGTDWRVMGEALASADLSLVFASVVLSIAHLLVRALRWRYLLAHLPRPAAADATGTPRLAVADCFAATVVGYGVTCTVPGRVGEVVRPALLWLWAKVPGGAALASVVFERLLDMATLVAMLVAFLLVSPGLATSAIERSAYVLLAAVVLAGAVGLYLFTARRAALERTLIGLARRLPSVARERVLSLVASSFHGFDSVGAPGAWWKLPAWSAATWLPPTLSLQAAMLATHAEAQWTAVLLLIPLSAVGIAVPTPAGVGGYHAAVTYGLALLGVDRSVGAAAAVVAHASSVIPTIGLAMVFAGRRGLSTRSVREAMGGPATGPTPPAVAASAETLP
jgi:hypothetical protein